MSNKIVGKLRDFFECIGDNETIDTIRVFGDFCFCMFAAVVSLRNVITGSNELVPNILWWLLSGILVVSGAKALGNLVEFTIPENEPEFGDEILDNQ